MLKRKLIRTGLASNALLIIIALTTTAGTRLYADSVNPVRNDTIQQQWLRLDTALLELSSSSESLIAEAPRPVLNKQAKTFVNTYLARNTSNLEKIKARSEDYFNIMDSIFNEYQLPDELKYLAVIESQLKNKAVSRVGAVGAWQFMATTARGFSLKVTRKYDERKDIYKSTVAAAKYLSYLHTKFGDWLLVIAAYNAGPGKVYQAIKRSGSRNFWKLQHFLPAETRGHVKKFIGTHYYFEGEAGLTTLTKEETKKYKAQMIAFVTEQNKQLEESQILADNTDTTLSEKGVAILPEK